MLRCGRDRAHGPRRHRSRSARAAAHAWRRGSGISSSASMCAGLQPSLSKHAAHWCPIPPWFDSREIGVVVGDLLGTEELGDCRGAPLRASGVWQIHCTGQARMVIELWQWSPPSGFQRPVVASRSSILPPIDGLAGARTLDGAALSRMTLGRLELVQSCERLTLCLGGVSPGAGSRFTGSRHAAISAWLASV